MRVCLLFSFRCSISFALVSLRRRLGTDRAPSSTTNCTLRFVLWIQQCALRAFPFAGIVRFCRYIFIALNCQIYHNLIGTVAMCHIEIDGTRSKIHTALRSASHLRLLRSITFVLTTIISVTGSTNGRTHPTQSIGRSITVPTSFFGGGAFGGFGYGRANIGRWCVKGFLG